VLLGVLGISDDAIVVCDTSCHIMNWNVSAVRLFGYAADEVVGRPVASLVRGHHREDVRRVCERVKAGDDVRRFDSRLPGWLPARR
jgi:PAS domain S-box-containing protein